MRYVDGFVIPIPKKNLPAYQQMARRAGQVWRKHGALDYIECVGDDLNPPLTGVTFSRIAKAKPGETVVFSYIVFKSRAHRDRVNAKVMKDPLMNDPKYMGKKMPFDMKRVAYGGFKSLVVT